MGDLGYDIAPNDGYVLHDRAGGWDDIDPVTLEPVFYRAYYRGSCGCGPNYDFTPAQITLDNGTTVTAYGSREFFAIPESEVPADQVFGVTNDHETM